MKTIAIYHFALPQIFQVVENGFKWDGDEQLRAAILGNLNSLFFAGDIIQTISDQIIGNNFNWDITPVLSTVNDVIKLAAKELPNAESVSYEDILQAIETMSYVTGDLVGIPVKGPVNTVNGIVDIVNNETEYPVRRALGFSEYKLNQGTELWDLPKRIMDILSDGMDDPKKPISDTLIKAKKAEEGGVKKD